MDENGNMDGFAYEPKSISNVPIYAGRATDYEYDDSYSDGAVRKINIYEMGD